MAKKNVLDEFFTGFQVLLTFLRDYAKENPDFRNALEAALSKHPDLKKAIKVPGPLDYVEQHGFPAFKEHLATVDEGLLRAYSKHLKLKFSKSTPVDDIRQEVLLMIERRLNKGRVFTE